MGQCNSGTQEQTRTRCSSTIAAQDFRHLAQSDGEAVSDFLCRLERTFQLAYGRDHMSAETRSTFNFKKD